MLQPIDFHKWIDEHRELLKPPVGNKVVWKDRELIVMVVGGPNARKDYHVNEGEEFFYQLEGDIRLGIMEKGKSREIPIREGQIFLLPANTPHCPRRPAGTVGLVIERRRLPGERDGFQWYCEKCHAKLYEEFFHLTDIEEQLKEVFARFYGDERRLRCAACGHKMERP